MQPRTPLFTVAQIRTLEQQLIEQGIATPSQLMQQAGQLAFQQLRQCFPQAKQITVVCGPGANGGDGYVLAQWAKKEGLNVTVLAMMDKTAHPLTRVMQEQCIALGIPLLPYAAEALSADLIVDALLGIGFTGTLEPNYARVIEAMHAARVPILAIDVPSGVVADTGVVPTIAVKASYTVSFIGHKRGLFTGQAVDHVGSLVLHPLGAERYYQQVEPSCFLLNEQVLGPFAKRNRNAHKGDHGFVSIIGGDLGFGGAVLLAGTAALLVGAGLVQILSHPQHQTAFLAARPELMVFSLTPETALSDCLRQSNALVIGPGLGQSDWSKLIWRQVEELSLPAVMDADGLNLLAQSPQHADHWVLSPHPKEAARLLAQDVLTVEADRFKAVSSVQRQYGGVAILKGAGTLIATSEEIWVCGVGNPGMATAGMGDVLSGVIGGLIAQGLSLVEAAKRGVWLHARAGDRAAVEFGERGLCAQDLITYLRFYNQSPS